MMQAVLNHLWQSTLFGGGVALLALALRRTSASLRFWLWLAASAKFLVPFTLLWALGERLAPVFDPGPELRTLGEAARFPELLPSGPVVTSDLNPVFDPAPWLLALWAAGLIAISAARLLKWRKLRSVLRSSRPLPSTGPILVRVSRSILEPGLFGVRTPVVLLPESLPQTLRPDEIEAILAHEAAHARRRDNLWAAFHMLVEALVWFHPMVWWIGRRLVAERERACDDAVVERGHRREVYARAILESCRVYLSSPLACVSGASGSSLADRVEAIMTAPAPRQATARQKAILLAASVLVLGAPLLMGILTAAGAGQTSEALIARAMPSRLFDSGPTPAQIIHDFDDQKRPRTAAPFDPARFDAYAGDYAIRSYAIMTVFRRGDRFFTRITGLPPSEIAPEGGGEFFYKAIASQITFVAGAGGRITGLTWHEGGYKIRLTRLDPVAAAARRASLARRVADKRPSPGTEAYVRRWAVSIATGRPDYSQMAPGLAQEARAEWPQQQAIFKTLGPFKGLRFLSVSPQGADLYEADFQNRRLFTRVEPLVQGKATQHFWRVMS